MLPKLSGTEKQITWANDIRKEALTWSESNIEKLREKGTPNAWLEQVQAAFNQVISQPELYHADWWIKRRKLHYSQEAPYEQDITVEMKSILAAKMALFRAEHKDEIVAGQMEKQGLTIRKGSGIHGR